MSQFVLRLLTPLLIALSFANQINTFELDKFVYAPSFPNILLMTCFHASLVNKKPTKNLSMLASFSNCFGTEQLMTLAVRALTTSLDVKFCLYVQSNFCHFLSLVDHELIDSTR